MKFRRPKIFGIVNITHDSFSDGGRFLDADKAIKHAERLVSDGAYAIDLGPASSHPDAESVSPDEEIQRLSPVITELRHQSITVSIDSYQPATQRYCISQKVAFLNDIQGFPYQEFYSELAEAQCGLVVMHSVQRIGGATRVDIKPDSIFESIMEFFSARIRELTVAGVDRERIILDPGMGFFLGGNPDTSLTVLRKLADIRSTFNMPLLVSVSRKSFLRKITGRTTEEIGAATLAAEIALALQGVDYIRTHDVSALNDALKVLEAINL